MSWVEIVWQLGAVIALVWAMAISSSLPTTINTKLRRNTALVMFALVVIAVACLNAAYA